MSNATRVVLVGCGGISRAWFRAISEMDEVAIVGLVDLLPENAKQRAADFHLVDARIGTDLGAMLDELAPDAVFNCTVPEAHASVTLKALAHDCHVLGEKPLADTMENARKMVAAAQEAGKTFAVIQNRRYDTNIRRLQQLVKSGVLGPITTLNSDFYLGAHFGGFRDHMEHVLLLDMAIHTFDAARFISGADPVSVYCKEWNPSGSWYDRDASAIAVYQMSDGLVYTYRGSWCAEGLNTTWESDWRVIGEKGSATWDGADDLRADIVVNTGEFRSELEALDVPAYDAVDMYPGHAGVIREFVRCIRECGVPLTVGSDNIKSLGMVLGAIESAECGVPVEITI